MKYVYIVLFNGLIYAAFGWWTSNTTAGRTFKTFITTWRADGWVHGIMCSVSVFIWGVVGILALGLTFKALGI